MTRRAYTCLCITALAACTRSIPVSRAPRPTSPSTSGTSEAVIFRNRVLETTDVRIELHDFTMYDAQLGELRFRVTNLAHDTVHAGLGYQIKVGGWGANRSRGTGDVFVFTLAPGKWREEAVRILVPGYSIDTRLGLSYGTAEPLPQRPGHGRLVGGAREWTYSLADSPWARAQTGVFAIQATPRLQVIVRTGTGLEGDLARLTHERDEALSAIANLLGVEPPGRVRMVFYPDPILKWIDTGHWGTGLAFDSTIVEVRNESERMDPFHELTHLVAERVGSPPALFREGLAVYVAQRLGGDALNFVDLSGSVEDVVCTDLTADKLIPLQRLISFGSIGDAETTPAVSYPESASFVGYLIRRDGLDHFLRAFRQLSLAGSSFAQVFGEPLPQVEQSWLVHVREACVG